MQEGHTLFVCGAKGVGKSSIYSRLCDGDVNDVGTVMPPSLSSLSFLFLFLFWFFVPSLSLIEMTVDAGNATRSHRVDLTHEGESYRLEVVDVAWDVDRVMGEEAPDGQEEKWVQARLFGPLPSAMMCPVQDDPVIVLVFALDDHASFEVVVEFCKRLNDYRMGGTQSSRGEQSGCEQE